MSLIAVHHWADKDTDMSRSWWCHIPDNIDTEIILTPACTRGVSYRVQFDMFSGVRWSIHPKARKRWWNNEPFL